MSNYPPALQDSYLGKVIIFDHPTGCIPGGSVCYCYRVDRASNSIWVCFKQQILGRHDIKLHIQVIIDHGREVTI